MLHISTLPLGDYQTNCYIAYAEGSAACAVIDPGYEAQRVLDKAAELGLSIEAILLTHGHFDHVGAVKELVAVTGCGLWMHEGDYSQFRSPTTAFFYPLANCDFTEVRFCQEGQVICAGGLQFKTLETPGHTHGSVCYRCCDALFSGDTLFAGSCGRTDLPGGDRIAMADSLERLGALAEDVRLFPGHGPASTLSHEQQNNPYLL